METVLYRSAADRKPEGIILAPAVVAAAMAAVPPDRAGLASAVNNTARQADGAIGIAALGAVAGSPTRPGQFVPGMHTGALIAAALYLLAALMTVSSSPRIRMAMTTGRSRVAHS